MDHLDKQLRHQQILINRVKDLYARTRLFHWDHKTMLDRRRTDLHGHPSWSRATGYVREYVRGYESACYDALDRFELVYAYDVDSRRYCLGTPEFKALDPCYVTGHATWSGYVWRDAPMHAFSENTTFAGMVSKRVAQKHTE